MHINASPRAVTASIGVGAAAQLCSQTLPILTDCALEKSRMSQKGPKCVLCAVRNVQSAQTVCRRHNVRVS